jgi:hypothetical protein
MIEYFSFYHWFPPLTNNAIAKMMLITIAIIGRYWNIAVKLVMLLAVAANVEPVRELVHAFDNIIEIYTYAPLTKNIAKKNIGWLLTINEEKINPPDIAMMKKGASESIPAIAPCE